MISTIGNLAPVIRNPRQFFMPVSATPWMK